MKPFKLDRTAFGMHSHADTEKRNIEYWTSRSPEERLAAAAHLNSVAYHFSQENPPRLDKTVFSTRKR